MEKKLAQAQAQLISRAAVLLQIGAVRTLRTHTYPSLGWLDFSLDSFRVEFDPDKGKPYDEEVLNAAIAELDAKIAKAKSDAQAAVSLIEAWGA